MTSGGVPTPVSAPHPEIMIGGNGEKKTLKMTAWYADACNLIALSPPEIAHKLDVLRRHCDDAGRHHAQIRTTVIYAGDTLRNGDLDAFAREMTGYAELGIDTVIVSPPVPEPARWIEDQAAPAVRRLAELS